MGFKAFTLLFLSGLNLGIVVADSGYYPSCNSIGVGQPGSSKQAPAYSIILVGNCRENSGQYAVDTEINLNYCFASDGGALHARAGGGMGASCSNIYLSGSVLHATCGNGNGGTVAASIDTNDYIGDYNGHLTCFGSSGF